MPLVSAPQPAEVAGRPVWRPNAVGPRVLAAVRVVHGVVFVVMATSAFLLLYAGLTGASGTWLHAAEVLLGVEVIAFVGNGLKCPLTTLALRFGADQGHTFDLFLSQRFARYSFRFFGTVMAAGTILLALRWIGAIR